MNEFYDKCQLIVRLRSSGKGILIYPQCWTVKAFCAFHT